VARRRHKHSSKAKREKGAEVPRQAVKAKDTSTQAPRSEVASRSKTLIAALAAAAIVLTTGLLFELFRAGSAPSGSADHLAGALSFVGSDVCVGCHRKEEELWHASQHAHAMDHATEASVLGDFSDASLDHFGVHSRFFRKDDKFFVETDGSDGKLADFEVKYTFGVYPLQQYLVAFPDGRIQALPLAWDSRPKEEGGQRWFHLYPNEAIPHDDVLHWTKLNQNWNFMCAECHSTGVRKNYDAEANRFATTWTEISVGCEACHGQGSRHVAWAKARQSWWPFAEKDPDEGLLARFDERTGVTWSHDPKTDFPQRSAAPATLRKEVEMCGRCHARRGQISEDWVPGRPLSDTHIVSLLAQGLYQADGQMLDEVYNYGSFKQSKMFAKGVTCSDCHDPHSAKLRLSGNQVCLQCHAGKYAEDAHTHHQGVTPALTCVSCHMPTRTYMVVDKRHDHSFRIPRPDLSAKLGVSNACNDCHTDKSAEWAASAITEWFGPKREGFQNYAEAFHAAWADQSDAASLLAAVASDATTPAFARASALSELAAYLSPSNFDLAKKGLSDPDPEARLGALDLLQNMPPAQLWPLVSQLLSDTVRGVRIRAAYLLAGMPIDQLRGEDRKTLDQATQEFIAAQNLDADRPEARTMLASFYVRQGHAAEAEAEYQAALRLSPAYAPAAANLADLYRELGRDGDAERVLRKALEASPQDAGLHHVLGLTLVRLKRPDQAIEELRQATELDPNSARYAFVYAVGLDSTGHRTEATKVLTENLARHSNDRDTLTALIGFSRDVGDDATALAYAERLSQIEPSDPSLAKLIDELRGEISQEKGKQKEPPNGVPN
jgi:predicted CXXCH cytochrome family protein